MKSDFEDWLDEIRISINDHIKSQPVTEAAYINDAGRRVAEAYGIRVVRADSPVDDARRLKATSHE